MPKPKYRRFDDEGIDGFRFRLWNGQEFLAKFRTDTSSKEIILDFDEEDGGWQTDVHVSDLPKIIQVLQEVLKQSTFKE